MIYLWPFVNRNGISVSLEFDWCDLVIGVGLTETVSTIYYLTFASQPQCRKFKFSSFLEVSKTNDINMSEHN